MTLTNTEAVTDLSILESLDFDPELDCELTGHPAGYGGHGGPAWALIRISCLGCQDVKELMICRGRWVQGHHPDVLFCCQNCGQMGRAGDFWTLLRVLR